MELQLRTNADLRDSYRLMTDGETGFDLDGWALKAQVRRRREAVTVLAEWSTANGRIVVDGSVPGLFGFDVDRREIELALPPGSYLWDLTLQKDDIDLVPVEGTLTVVKGITR